MSRRHYWYDFAAEVSIEEIESSLLLAIMAAESLHGESQTRLDVAHYLDTSRRRCVIDADTRVGRDLNRLFTGFLRREFGEDAFRVKRVSEPRVSAPAAVER
jgi:hypothetical protein